MRKNREFWLALFAIILISGFYAGVVFWTRNIPAAGDLFGHSLGILGFILMLMTEILYSMRKRTRSARWGRMSSWLQFHIFTGLVGPFMVLLHTSWKYGGLAGVTTMLTVVIVISGFIGRYIYTRIPRTVDGLEVGGLVSPEIVANTRRLMALWHAIHIPIGMALFISAFIHVGAALYYATFLK